MARAPTSAEPFPLRADGFFVLRTPLLPLEALAHWSAGLEAPAALTRGEGLAAALETDRRVLRERLREQLGRPQVREALYVASPSLEGSLSHWLEAPDSERGQKAERALVRYFQRMASRPTPFGLFAGCSVGRVAQGTALEVPGLAGLERHTRLDMGYLFALGDALSKAPEARAELRLFPNSSLYEAGGRLRYAEVVAQERDRRFKLVVVEPNPYLTATLERARGGARLESLAQALVASDAEITADEARTFIHELLDSQLLVTDLEPNVTGPESLQGLCQVLAGVTPEGPLAAAREALTRVGEGLAALDAAGVGQPSTRYAGLAQTLEALPAKVDIARLFQVDLLKRGAAPTVGPQVVRELERALEVLHRLSAPSEDPTLKRFKERFGERYEEREVPLMEALDDEAGVGFDSGTAELSPLLDQLALGIPEPWGPAFHARHAQLLGRLVAAAQAGALEVELKDEDVEALRDEAQRTPPPLPDALGVSCTLLADSPAGLADGAFRLQLHSAGGPSGVNLLGRFVETDPELEAAVRQHLRAEEALAPDAIFAELVHLPEGRLGNILHRPVLREVELVYLGRSGAPEERRLPLTDLLVSMAGGRVVLRSQALGKRVVPRLTNAHNWRLPSNPAAYRFLCALQMDGHASLGLSWGPLARSPFLPRVRYGRVLLSLARWRLEKRELATLNGPGGVDLFGAAQALRAARRLPRHVALVDGDNHLPVDFDNVLSVETFCHLVKEREEATLEELTQSAGTACARGPEGTYAHELVLPFVRRGAPTVTGLARPHPAARTPAPQRTFGPGSEWLYLKLFSGSITVDRILRELVAPALDALRARGAFDRWFFLRYGDPDWHLRLRLHGAPEALQRDVLPSLMREVGPWLADGRVWRVQVDTYEREVERYGGPVGIGLAEALFHHDSEAVLGITCLLSGDAGLDARWRLGLRGADLLLQDLGFELDAKLRVMEGMAAAYAREHGVDGERGYALGEKFRRLRPELQALLDPTQDEGSELAPGFSLLRRRSAALVPTVAALQEAQAQGTLTRSLEALAPSYLHMHLNRLLRSTQRAQETVLYDFLARLYRSEKARRAKGATGGR